MILVKPSTEILTPIDGMGILRSIERAGRTCYKSEEAITDESCLHFCQKLIARGHFSVIEHESISVQFLVDRGVSHEIVRHRICTFSQESTRYCNYKGGVTFVIPPWIESDLGECNIEIPLDENIWYHAVLDAERNYLSLLQRNWTPQQARSVLPNSLKTEIVVTANLREWRHIFSLRTAKAAHPQMREVIVPLLSEFREKIPVLFDEVGKGV